MSAKIKASESDLFTFFDVMLSLHPVLAPNFPFDKWINLRNNDDPAFINALAKWNAYRNF
jgi:hypothetical protein